MKIAFLMRSDYKWKRGGDVVQVEAYCRELERMGHQCGLLSNLKSSDCLEYDCFVLVNIDRPVETVNYWGKLKRTIPEKKVFVIPIHHPIEEINRFEIVKRGLGYRCFNYLFPDFYVREKIKNFIRFRKDFNFLVTSFGHLFISYRQAIARIVRNSDGVVYISNGEKLSVERDFGVSNTRHVVAHNAVELGEKPALIDPKFRAYDVIVVGRIEPRKNQITVLEALEETNYRVCFVGAANGNSDKYFNDFISKTKEKANINYLGVRPYSETLNLIADSRMLLNASYFEVNPLVDLEAALLGTQVVSTKYSYTSESLPNVLLADPWDKLDIRQKVDTVLGFKKNTLEGAQVFESWLEPAKRIESMIQAADDY